MSRYIDPEARADLERRVAAEDARALREDRKLEILYWVILFGFLVAGVIGLCSTPINNGIG